MVDLLRNFLYALGGILIGLAGGMIMISQSNPICPQIAWFLLSIGVFLLAFPLVLNIYYRKPLIIFGSIRIGAGDGEKNHFLAWYLPVINKELEGWRSLLAKRGEARRCRVIIDFLIGDKLLGSAEYWNELPTGMTLFADSSPHEIPIIYSDSSGDWISLVGDKISTKPAVPPYALPFNTDIIAVINVKSGKKVLAKSRWRLYFRPTGIERIEIEQLD